MLFRLSINTINNEKQHIINDDKLVEILIKYPRDLIDPTDIPRSLSVDRQYPVILGISNYTQYGSIQLLMYKFNSTRFSDNACIKQESWN